MFIANCRRNRFWLVTHHMLLVEHMAGIRRSGSNSCCTHCRVACCKKVKPQRKWGQDAPRSVLITICYETCAPRRKRREIGWRRGWGGEGESRARQLSVSSRTKMRMRMRMRTWCSTSSRRNSALMMMLSDLHRMPAFTLLDNSCSTLHALFTFPKWKVFSLLPHCILFDQQQPQQQMPRLKTRGTSVSPGCSSRLVFLSKMKISFDAVMTERGRGRGRRTPCCLDWVPGPSLLA